MSNKEVLKKIIFPTKKYFGVERLWLSFSRSFEDSKLSLLDFIEI